MAIWSRRSDSELPASQVEYQETRERRWPTLLGYMLLALLVATAIVLSGKWLYNQFAGSADDTPKPVSIKTDSKKQTDSTNANKSEDKKAARSGSSSTSNGNSENNDNSPSTSPSPTALPNNGPGQVIALFVSTSLAAAGLHYIITLRTVRN